MNISKSIKGYKARYFKTKDAPEVKAKTFNVKLVPINDIQLAIEDPASRVIITLPMKEVMELIDILNKELENAGKGLETAGKGN